MLEGHVATRLPAQDLERARRFYATKLGLEPADERPGGLLYRGASGEFALFGSAGASPGTFTQMAWVVEDIEATVAELRSRGVQFEEYDRPGLKTVGESLRSMATTRARAPAASGPRGSTTARAICSRSGSSSADRSSGRASSSPDSASRFKTSLTPRTFRLRPGPGAV